MKRTLLSLLTLLVALTGRAQTIGEAFYVYRSDGMINTFFRSEVDSMAYSYYDVDSTYYDEPVTQVVYTPDSIYRIPLAMVDSVGFVTPETKYQPGVVKLEGTIRDYIIGSDSLTVFFRSDTPSGILPKIGDKLVTTEMSETFMGGFLGQVEEREQRQDTIAFHCSAIGIEEVFECFYYTTNGEPQSESNKARVIGLDWNNYYAPGPFVYSNTRFLDVSLKPINCPFKVSPRFDFSVAPIWKCKGSIIVHPLLGVVVVSADIRQDVSFQEDWAVSGELEKTHDFPPFFQGSYPILPFVTLYGKLGVFVKANAKLAFEEHCRQALGYNIHYEATYRPLLPAPFSISIPKIKINNVSFTTEHDEKFMFDGYLAAGLYGEIGIAPLLSRHILSAGFRFEGGAKLGGNVMIYNSDGEGSLISTSPYERARAGELYIKPFCKVGLQAELLFVGKGEVNVYEHEWELGRFKLVPDFSNTTLKRDRETPSTLIAATKASGATAVPTTLGFKLFEEEEQDGIKGSNPYNYWSLHGYPEPYYDTFDNQSLVKPYTVYPTVNIFGLEMLATPSAEIGLKITPVTLEVENIIEDITDTTAKVWGKIEGFELLDETMTFGLGYINPSGKPVMFSASSIMDAEGTFSLLLYGLKPNRTYKYFAFVIINGETYKGEYKEFTTDGQAQLYGISEDGFHLTYYYDGKRDKRTSVSWNSTDITTVTFDASVANYKTSRWRWFGPMSNLTSIEHIEYLNTSEITDMSFMFYGCYSLTSLNLSSFDTSKVANMNYMFQNCNSLTRLDLSNFDTSNVFRMAGMFSGCKSLTSLNVRSFNTSKVTDMALMFDGCSSLTSLNVSSFNTAKVTRMSGMFAGCSSLTSLDLSNFIVNNCSFDYMFHNCHSLRAIYTTGKWTDPMYSGQGMFDRCNSLEGGEGTKVGKNFYGNDENGVPLYYYCPDDGRAAHTDGGKDNPGLFR